MKNHFSKRLFALKILSLLIIMLTTITSCKVGRFAYYNFSDITDYKIFPSQAIQKSTNTFSFQEKQSNLIPDTIAYSLNNKEYKYSFNTFLEKNKTVAFLVIKNDTIVYNNYFSNYNEESIVASFSMAKSVLSLLIGCAIDDGYIKSVNDPITNYLPELKKNGFEKIKINNLLNMTSGIDFKESYYNPLGEAASFYYGRNLEKEVSKLKLKRIPSEEFHYSSGDSQILGLVLKASLKEKSISEYLQEKIWQPLGMEYDATWSLDRKNGVEKTFCCLNARASDFAKIGRLYLNKGNWNGKQIVSEDWITKSTVLDTSNGNIKNYQNQWWINPKEETFSAKGINGQYIYVNSNKKIIIVRLGKRYGKVNWEALFKIIADKV
jgi:CubicO group peptidase (beta-lactamase class C family)